MTTTPDGPSGRRRAGRLAAGALLALLLVLPAAAQNRVATTAAPFLTLGTGARGSALGHAYSATASGADALFWNPAGIARAGAGEGLGSVFLSRTEWFAEIDYNALGVSIPVTRTGVFGLSIAQLDYGRMDVRTVDAPQGTGETFGASDLVAGLSYAQPLTDAFYVGGTFKYVRQAIYDLRARSAAIDIGLLLVTDYLGGARLAASIQNFGGKMRMGGVNLREFHDPDARNEGNNEAIPVQYETGSFDLPLSFKFGAALPVVRHQNVLFELYGDAHQPNDNALNLDAGGQLRLSVGPARLDLRAGYKDLAAEEEASHLTFGGGLSLEVAGRFFAADFAYIPFERLGHVQMFDLRFAF